MLHQFCVDAPTPKCTLTRGLLAAFMLITVTLFSGCERVQQVVNSPDSVSTDAVNSCTDGARVLNVGFYAFFAPVSYSANEEPGSAEFNTHLGYEADLLAALEAMEGAGLSFKRTAIPAWDGIWLKSTEPAFDMIGGGITILESRTRDADGTPRVIFTSGHINFQQSLLVRAEDAERLATHAALTSDVRVGALPGTTGENRLLQLTALTNADGILAAGTRVDTPQGTVVADGTDAYVIQASGATPNLEGRTHLYPPSENMPQVVYLGSELGESELLAALEASEIEAVARGGIGNGEVAAASGGALVVTAFDEQVEYGGFTFALEDAELAACIDEKINYLTNNRAVGYAEWLADPGIFMKRAEMWNAGTQ